MTEKSSASAGARLLFADDDLLVRRAFARVFRRPTWEVDLAADGFEAVSLGTHGQYAGVILDHQMPGPSGADLIHRLRRLQPDAVFIVVTGYSDRARESCNTRGVNLVVSKPWDAETLAGLVTATIPRLGYA